MRRPILRSSGEDGRVHNESPTGLHGTCGSRSLCRGTEILQQISVFQKTSFSDAKEIRENACQGCMRNICISKERKHESNAEKWLVMTQIGAKICSRSGFSFQMIFSTQKILLPFNGGRCLRGHPQLELWKRCLQESGSRCGDVAGP